MVGYKTTGKVNMGKEQTELMLNIFIKLIELIDEVGGENTLALLKQTIEDYHKARSEHDDPYDQMPDINRQREQDWLDQHGYASKKDWEESEGLI